MIYLEEKKFSDCKETIKIGLPKGRFLERSLAIIYALGGEFYNPGSLKVDICSKNMKIYLLKSPDIANLVDSGMLDFGITSEEWYLEHCFSVEDQKSQLCIEGKLKWINTSLAFFPNELDSFEFFGKVCVATSFPKIAEKMLKENGIDEPDIFHVYGSVEALIPDIANLGFDCIETGGTLKANNLTPFYSPFNNLGMVAVSNKDARDKVSCSLIDLISNI